MQASIPYFQHTILSANKLLFLEESSDYTQH